MSDGPDGTAFLRVMSMTNYKACAIPGCEKSCPGTTKGMCWMHYYRERRHGDVNTRFSNGRESSIQERVYGIGWTVTPEGCWEWNGARSDKGYGSFRAGSKTYLAHRISYELHTGDFLVSDKIHGDVVMHSCDNPPCVNPAHLSKGTQQDNISDMISKDRYKNVVKVGG